MAENRRLIMFEGLPGTGKSTNSYFSYMQLEQIDKKVKWIHEVAHPHPVFPDFDNWASPLDKYIDVALQKWTHFTEKAIADGSEIYILDSGIFQYQIFTFLLKNAPYSKLLEFIQKLMDIIQPLNPSLIYFYRENLEDTIDFLENQRGKQSMESIYERDRSQLYYCDKPKGAEGFKQFLRDYANIAEQLYDIVNCQKILIEITNQDWKLYEDKILSFLGMERKQYLNVLPPNGVFRNETLNMEIEVKGLSIKDPEGIKRSLTPRSDTEFYVERLPVVLNFDGLDKITISGEQIIAKWTAIGTQFMKV